MTLTLPDRAAPEVSQPRSRRTLAGLWAVPEVRWATVATLLFAAGGAAQLAGASAAVFWTLYLACYATGGWEPARAGLQALRAKTLDVDLLMIVAALAAAAIGQVFDGALLIVIFATSGALEAWATRRTADSVRALLDLTPGLATRLTGAGEQVVPAAELSVGDRVLVRPGELLPADGTVQDGESDVDQASITGEPLPVAKLVGDEVFAGTMNGTGALTVRVERAPADSVVARIVTMVEQASATKATTQLFIEKVEQRYSVAVVAGTVALIAVPLLVLGAEFQPTLLRAMTFMIVASPCAVVLATMPPLLASIANAGRHGVLVKSAVVMEKLADVEAVAFDKTGTLTEGRPRLADLLPLDGSDSQPDDLLALAAAAEERSEHPIGVAVVAAARQRRLTLSPASDFSSAPGRGVTATVDGHRVVIGSPGQVDALTRTGPSGRTAGLRELVGCVESRGSIAVVLVVDDEPEAVLELSDNLRLDAARAVDELTVLTGRSPVLLSGDNPDAVRAVGIEVGISDVHGGLLPEDKVAAVTALQREQRTLLVGDGVNDAPALATAHVGVAMGRRGSDLALETADAVIVHDELAALPAVLRLARRARRVVTTNLIIAGAVIITLICWDLIGDLPLVVGVAGHETSTVIVGLNGLRLLRRKAWTRS